MKKMLRVLAGILLFILAVGTCARAEELGFLRQISGGLAKLPPPNEMQALSAEEVEEWKQLAREAFPGMEPHYDPLSISIGTHTGPGAVAAAFFRTNQDAEAE